MSEQCYLVTGASGFVGGWMVDHLVRQGVKVRAMIKDKGKAGPLRKPGVEIVLADLRDGPSLKKAVEGITGVYHIAGLFRQAGLPESVFRDVNAEGTRRMLDASIAAGVRRFIHCSTVGVLGHVENPPANEETPYHPGDMYQRSKMEGEKIALDYFRTGRIPGVVIRPAMIYGPGDLRMLKMFRMIARKRFFYVGRGDARVHFIDVRDLVRAFELAMQKEQCNGGIYIIAGERSLPLHEMAALVARQLGVPAPWLHIPVKPMQWLGSLCEALCTPLNIPPPLYRRRVDFYTKSRWFDGSKAERDLGFKPAKRLEDELADIVEWYRSNGKL